MYIVWRKVVFLSHFVTVADEVIRAEVIYTIQ